MIELQGNAREVRGWVERGGTSDAPGESEGESGAPINDSVLAGEDEFSGCEGGGRGKGGVHNEGE